MTKKIESNGVAPQHQTALRIMLSNRAASQANLQAQQNAIMEFVTQLLDERGLDKTLWGIDRTLSKFVLLDLPKGTVEPSEKAAQSIAEVKERSGKENMLVPEQG